MSALHLVGLVVALLLLVYLFAGLLNPEAFS